MQSELDGDSVTAEVVLLRAAADRTILIVEGDVDARVMLPFIDEETCELVIASGKANAIPAIQRLRELHVPGVLCILDSDYSEILGTKTNDDNIVFSDGNDLETMLFRSKALKRVLIEIGSAAKIKALKEKGRRPECLVIGAVMKLGALRLVSQARCLNLRFQGLRYRFIDRGTLAAEIDGMVREVLGHSQRMNLDAAQIRKDVEAYAAKYGKWDLCSGHDLTAALGKGLQVMFGTNPAGNVSKESVEERLRLAFSREDFLNTKLRQEILDWEALNEPYTCLSA